LSAKLGYPKNIGLISGTGDRRDEDIVNWEKYRQVILTRSSSAVIKIYAEEQHRKLLTF
jgi:hypothetical protein